MAHPRDQRLPEDLRDIAARLRDERPEPTPLELDRMKLLAMSRAAREAPRTRSRRRLRARLASPVLAAVLLVGGLAAIAGGVGETPFSSGGSNASSANSQYCPPSSPGAGKPKKQPGGNKCGQPNSNSNSSNNSKKKK